MQFADNELARREGDKVAFRPTPLRAAWTIDDLVTSDGHQLRCRFSCSLRVLESPIERKMLQETFLGHGPSLSVQDVIAHFAPAIHAAADKAAYMRDVETVLQEQTRQAMCHSLRQVVETVAFSCGLEGLAPFDLQVESPSYRRMQLERAQRVLIEQRVAGQTEHLNRAAELLRTFEQARQQAPELTASVVLQQLSPADQGATLQMLLLADAQRHSAALLAVAGDTLVTLDLEEPDTHPVLHPFSDALGPLRSVRRSTHDARPQVLVGARDGVWVAPEESPAAAKAYADPSVESPLGFSRALFWQGQLWACHSAGGLVAWDMGHPGEPAVVHRPAALAQRMDLAAPAQPRHLVVLDDERLLFSDGPRLCLLERSDAIRCWSAPTDSPIVEIVREADLILTIHADGSLCRRNVTSLEQATLQQHAGGIGAVGVLPWLGTLRLLLATEEGPVLCIAPDDPLVTRYLSPHRGLRMVGGSPRAVAAVSADRRRLVIWNSWDGRQPVRELHLAGLTRHRIADIDL